MNAVRAACLLTAASVLMMAALPAKAHVSAGWRNQDSQLVNSFSVGASIGTPYEKEDAEFWGLSVDYSRTLSANWSASASLTFDQATTRQTGRPTKVVNSFAAVLLANYALSPRWSLTTGLSQDFLDDDNADGELRFKLGDVGTGLAIGVAFPNSVGLSFAWEWNISESEPSVSLDISYSWEF